MNRASQEIDRLRDEAWGSFAGDVRATARKHPLLLLGGGILMAALAVWRLRRPAPRIVECSVAAPKRTGLISRLLGIGRLGLGLALSFASHRAENRRA